MTMLRRELTCIATFFHVICLVEPASTEFHPLSLHDALPIWAKTRTSGAYLARGMGKMTTAEASPTPVGICVINPPRRWLCGRDRKSTRLNSSHLGISYAVFCLKKKNTRHLLPQEDRRATWFR